MRRLVLSVVIALVAVVSTPLVGGTSTGPSTLDLQAARRVAFFYFGSGANPLLNGTCGRVIGGSYILPASIEPGTELTCRVPRDTPLLGTPGGAIAWAPTDGTTARELSRSVDDMFETLCCPRATVDGRRLSVFEVKSPVHPMKLQPGNFIQTVDPAVTGTSTLVAHRLWLVSIAPLSPGQHTVVTSDVFPDGQRFDITFHLRVT